MHWILMWSHGILIKTTTTAKSTRMSFVREFPWGHSTRTLATAKHCGSRFDFLRLMKRKGGSWFLIFRRQSTSARWMRSRASSRAASGNRREVASRGAMTTRTKEADATFGPKRTTRHQTLPPAPRTVSDWVTLAVEVGRSQTWARLVDAAEWWCGYAGIQYVLLIKISSTANHVRYALYDMTVRGTLPAPRASGTFTFRPQSAVHVFFDMHRILSIPPTAALPPGVGQTARVDLRIVLDLVIDSLD